MKTTERQAWQSDPSQIKTSTVQLWTAQGTMATAIMPLEMARKCVENGNCFVISDQAIGSCDK